MHSIQKLSKFLSIFLSLSIVFSIVGPFNVFAGSNYFIDGVANTNGKTVTVSGQASANPFIGQENDQHVSIDWNIDKGSSASNSKSDWETVLNILGNTDGTFASTTWSGSHTYTSSGDYTIFVRVHHAQPGGAESGSGQISFNIKVNLECSDSIDNDTDGLIDANDPGCWTNPSDSTTYNPLDNDETDSVVPPTDVCPNVAGVQPTTPCDDTICTGAGNTWDVANQTCVVPSPTDFCPNLDGAQASVPAGYHIEGENCVADVVPPTDLCSNVAGNQTTTPCADVACTEAGNTWNIETQACILPPIDVCSNVNGVQSEGPCADITCTEAGNTWNSENQTCVVLPTDMCANVTGNQTTTPCADAICTDSGKVWNVSTQTCNDPTSPTDSCPNVTGVQIGTPCADAVCTDLGNTWNAETQACIAPPPVDVCSNLDGAQASVPAGYHPEGTNCIADSVAPSGGNGGGGGGGSSGGRRHDIGGLASQGEILGASTSTICGLYMDRYIRVGADNDVEQVQKLQNFLNKNMKAGLEVTGVYDQATLAAVKEFQSTYADEILKPWGLTSPTGIVYITTLRWINMLECSELALEVPELVDWSNNPEAPAVYADIPVFSQIKKDSQEGSNPFLDVAPQSQPASAGSAVKKGGFWNNLIKIFRK